MRPCSSPRGRAGAPALLAALALVAGDAAAPALAAQWTVRPSIDAGAVRDDNIRLTPGGEEEATGYIAAAKLDVERAGPRSQAELEGAVAHTDYREGDVEDRTDHRARLRAEYLASERSTLGLRAEYRRDTLFETILLDEGTGDIQDVDVGLTTETEVQRYYRVIQPSWEWLLSELSAIEFGYRRSDVNFARAEGTGLVDYRSDQLSASYRHRLSAQNSYHVTAVAGRYRAEGRDNEADTLQLLTGMARDFSESLEGSFGVGVSRTTETTGTREDRASGLVLRAALRQEAELSRFEGIVSRDVTPSGIGRALQTDQLRLYWTRALTPTTEFALDARWLQTEVVEGFDPNANRRYYDVSPSLSWRWLENVAVVASYTRRYQKYERAEAAESNTVFLGLSYSI